MAAQAFASRSRMQTCEPSSRKRAAVAAPIPLAPPVMRIRLCFRPRMKVTGSFRLRSRITGASGTTEVVPFPFVLRAGASGSASGQQIPRRFAPRNDKLDGVAAEELDGFAAEEVDELDDEDDD